MKTKVSFNPGLGKRKEKKKDYGHFIDLIALVLLLGQNIHKKDPQMVLTVTNIAF